MSLRDRLPDLAYHLRQEVELLISKWEGGSAFVSAGVVSDLAKQLAEVKVALKENDADS